MITINRNENLNIKGGTKATIKTSISIVGTNTTLPIEIVGEFKDIPSNLHEFYIQSMLSSYGNVNVYNNTDDVKKPITIKEKQREWRLKKIVNIICNKLMRKK
jgi:hypothetical protein